MWKALLVKAAFSQKLNLVFFVDLQLLRHEFTLVWLMTFLHTAGGP